jgi:hypothetical protein
MKKTANKAPMLTAISAVPTVVDVGPVVCRDAAEEAIIRAYRDLPRGEIQGTIVRLMSKYVTVFGARVRPRLSLVGSKGTQDE